MESALIVNNTSNGSGGRGSRRSCDGARLMRDALNPVLGTLRSCAAGVSSLQTELFKLLYDIADAEWLEQALEVAE